MKTWTHRLLCLAILCGFFIGCASREEVATAPGSNAEADAALAKAERIMQEAGIDVSFRDLQGLESLADLRQILPSPLEISILEDSQIEEAIDALYSVLTALGQPVAPAAPTLQAQQEVSKSDLALVHFDLAYLYILAAVARLERAKEDLYVIEFSLEDELDPDEEVYTFHLTPQGQALVDGIPPGADPGAYTSLFTKQQRRAILDALRLLVGAEVVVEAAPAYGIPNEERHSVDTSIYRRDALYHLTAALDIAQEVIPDLKVALEEFYDTIAKYFAQDMLDQVQQWGFRVENGDEVLARIDRRIQ